MTTATFKKINAAIAAQGYKAELIKGAGYFYFVGDDVRIDAPSTYTYRLTDFTVEEWMAEFAACVEPAPAGVTHAENRARRANEYGYEAGVEGDERRNPYGEDCAEHKAWEAGYEQGAQTRRESANGG